MPASYPTSAKAFTTKSDGPGNTILAAHINDLQAEVTAVETDLIAGLPVARGGTGLTALTANRIPYSSGSAFTSAAGFTFDGTTLTAPATTVTGAATLQSTLDVTGVSTFTGDVLTVAQTDYYASSTITGWSSLTAGRRYIVYKKIGKMVFVNFHLEGTSNATSASFTLPYTARTQYGNFGSSLTLTYDNSALISAVGMVTLPGGGSTAACYSNGGAGAWTASGTKIVSGEFWYWTD